MPCTFRELKSLEIKGRDYLRTHIVRYAEDPKKLPESVKLVQKIRGISPDIYIFFVTETKIGPNLKQALGDLGVTATIANDESTREQTLAFTNVLTETKKLGRAVRVGTKEVYAASKKLVYAISTNLQHPSNKQRSGARAAV